MGSGKSTICRAFEKLGVPVYYADDRAKAIIASDLILRSQIISLLGEDSYPEGKFDRRYVAQKIFGSEELLKQYNAIVHPYVLSDAEKWAEEHKEFPYTLEESALIFETGAEKKMDKIICVIAPEEVKIQRCMSRDNSTREEALRRIRSQWSEEQKMMRSDYVIVNAGVPPLEEMHQILINEQVEQIHEKLLNESARR
jgi:dephospho-CoA kinase